MLGVQRQEVECRELADRHGGEVVAVEVDDDVSAYSGRHRPGYRRLMDRVSAGEVDAVLAWAPDRLHRRLDELESFIDALTVHDVECPTVQSGDLNLSTSDGRLAARVIGVAARAESERKGERLRAKHRELAQDGKPPGGQRGFGYNDDHLINTGEAILIRDAVERILAGSSVNSVATEWGELGITTARGNPWRTGGLKRMLGSQRLAGYRKSGSTFHEAQWESIISLDQHKRLNALWDAHQLKAVTPRKYLLGGLIKCVVCGASMMSRPHLGTRGYICCRGAGPFQ